MNGFDEDDHDWPEQTDIGRKFSQLEQHLRCPICDEFLNNPQILLCGHTYCSICIRKHFDPQLNKTSSGTCPSCREKAEPFDLRRNSTICSIVQAYQSLRPMAHALVSNNSLHRTNDPEIEIVNESRGASGKSGGGIPIVKRMPHFSFHGMKKDKVKSTLQQVSGESRIKLRLDGEKDMMEKRLREFVHLHNAQIGSPSPLSLEQVVRAINEQEAKLEKETNRTSRSQYKIERIRNGETMEDVESNFAKLTQKIREHKDAALRKIASASAPNTAAPDDPVTDAAAITSADITADIQQVPSNSNPNMVNSNINHSSTSSSSSNNVHPSQQSESELAESARLVCRLGGLLQQGYDWGPWRVVMSRKLARPFFYHTLTGIGQFAVPPELAVVIDDESYSQDCGATGGAPEMSGENTASAVGVEGNNSGTSAIVSSQRLSQRSQRSCNSSSNSSSGPVAEYVNHSTGPQTNLLREEESPFHMLVDDRSPLSGPFRRLGSLQSASSGLQSVIAEQAHQSSAPLSYLPTATSTDIDLPQPTPFPKGVASYPSTSSSSSVPATTGIATTPGYRESDSQQVLTSTAFAAPADEWSCGTCTYLNNMQTCQCDMCGTVDQEMESRFNRPFLRSHRPAAAASTSSNLTGTKKKKASQQSSSSSTGKKTRK